MISVNEWFVFEKAIDNKTYPFDENVKFNIIELDQTSSLLPQSIREIL